MPISVSHALSATTPDDPAFEIRPSHWNSNHIATISAVGSEVIGAFSNAGNVSFGLDGGGYVTASANVTAAPSPVNITGANGSSVNAQTIAFSNSNGMTLGVSTAANGATVTGSYTVPTQTAFVFSNSNGVSFGTNGSTVTATVVTNYQSQGAYLTTARASNDALGLNTAASNVTWTANSSGVSIDARGYAGTGTSATNASVTLNSNGLQISVAAPGAGAAISAAGASASNGTIVFSNSNNFSFGMNGSTVTASYTVPTVTNSSWTVSDNATSATVGRLAFTQANGITMSLSTSNNGNHTVFASHNGLTTAAVSNHSHGFSASGGSSAFQTLNFVNGNGVTFTNNAGSVGASYTVPTVTDYFSKTNTTFNGANVSGSLTLNTAGLQVSLSVAAPGGGVTPVASASNGSFSFTTLAFSNANNVTFGTSAGSIITASVAAPGAAAENNAINLLGANTAGNTTATGSTIGWSGVNVTLSGTNNSQVVISAPATSSLVGVSGVSISTNGSTISVYDNFTASGYYEGIMDRELLATQIGNNQVFVQPLRLRNHVQFEEICAPLNFSNASNSSNSATLTMRAGIYTRNGSSLSLITQASGTYPITASGTAGNYSLCGGPREYPMALTTTLTKGDYYIAFLSRTTSGGGAGMSWSNFAASNINSAYSGRFSSANNATNQWVLGMGSYATTTTAFPSVIGFSDINGSAAVNLRPVIFKFVSGDMN